MFGTLLPLVLQVTSEEPTDDLVELKSLIVPKVAKDKIHVSECFYIEEKVIESIKALNKGDNFGTLHLTLFPFSVILL